ncbi:MAG TPA: hypothetical protein VF846_19605 [Thermoanaerobaculia bacterium]|jgi:hypothetical protein
MSGFTREQLHGTWHHAHEQDSPGLRVYVRDHTALPLSRGRHSFALMADHSAADVQPGANDADEIHEGAWELEEDGCTLIVAGRTTMKFRIESLTPVRMVVKLLT